MRTFDNEWIFQVFEDHPSFFTKRMFGGLAVYLFARQMMVLASRGMTRDSGFILIRGRRGWGHEAAVRSRKRRGLGEDPLWGPDSRELFYLTPEAAMVVRVWGVGRRQGAGHLLRDNLSRGERGRSQQFVDPSAADFR